MMLFTQPSGHEKNGTATTRTTELFGSDVSADFLLPDYYGDIHRVLNVCATPHITDCYHRDGVTEVSGTVTFSILYLSEEAHLHNLHFEETFTKALHLSADEILCTPNTENVVCRVQSPRKLNAKCKLSLACVCSQGVYITPQTEGHLSAAEEAAVQYDRTEVSGMMETAVEECDLSLAEQITLDPALPAVGEVVRANAVLHMEDCRCGAGEVTCRGTVHLCVLYRTESEGLGAYYAAVERKLPINVSLSHPDLSTEDSARAVATVTSLKVLPESDSYGEMRTLFVELSYDLLALCVHNAPHGYTRDAFSTLCPTDTVTDTLSLPRHIGNIRTTFSESMAKERTEVGAEAASMVLISLGEVRADNVTYDADKHRITFIGTATACVLLSDENGGDVSAVECTLPLRCDLAAPNGTTDNCTFSCICKCLGVSARLDTTTLTFSVECALDIGVTAVEPVSFVASIRPDTANPYPSDTHAIRLCYPAAGESLWNIAKAYHVSPDDILRANALSAEEAAGASVLLIARA